MSEKHSTPPASPADAPGRKSNRELDEELGIHHYAGDLPMVERIRDRGEPILEIYRPEELRVVLGRGSKVDEELRWETIEADAVPVYRRLGGGCSVVLDPGNVVVAVGLPLPGIGGSSGWFDRCTEWVIKGLAACGVHGVYKDGISDLVLEGRKIAGAALYRSKGVLLYGVTILVSADLSLIDRYLTHPPREPEYRKGRPHLAFVSSLRDAAGVRDAEELMLRLREQLDAEALLAEGTEPKAD